MKNLQVYRDKGIDFGEGAVGQCIDADNGILFILTRDSRLLKTKIRRNEQEMEIEKQNLGHLLGDLKLDDILLFEFMVETGSVFIALKNGNLFRIGVSSFSPPDDCIYRHQARISSIKLSPDQDLIALADQENNIYILASNSCEVIFQNNASTETNSLHKPVGVGWGSKETQFFGLDGRPSKEQQLKEEVKFTDDELAIKDKIENSSIFRDFTQKQERSTVIDWRGDGQYIATLTYFLESNKHCLKVWNRNLELQYMSEQLVTIEQGLLSWIPNGQYVCCAQRRDRGINEIAMFEKNGMVHQRISLPSLIANLYIKDVVWSPDSKILALLTYRFQPVEEEINFTPILMLYTMQNFHYYLKYSATLKENCDYFLRWDSINSNRLHTLSSQGHYNEYICSFKTTYSTQYSTVAVIDSNKILITPTEMCNVPPPMSAIVIELSNLISRMVLNPRRADSIFIMTLDDKLIYTMPSYEPVMDQHEMVSHQLVHHMAAKLYNNIKNYQIVSIADAQSYQNLTPLDEFSLVATQSTSEGCDILLLRLPKPESKPEVEFTTLASFKTNQIVAVSQDFNGDHTGLAVILDDGSCHWIDLLDSVSCHTNLLFNGYAPNAVQGYSIIDLQTIKLSQSRAVISLAQDFSLRFNSNVILASSCTSFRVTENYFIYTTTDNHIHLTLIEHLFQNKTGVGQSWTQQIETGGTLVVVSERDSKVVLQMPRGNLEILHPRLLVFSSLTELLDEAGYVEAVKMARRHRVNMNFIFDYLNRLPKSGSGKSEMMHKLHDLDSCNDVSGQDCSPLRQFLVAVGCDPSLICLVLTELNNEDTTETRYKDIVGHLPKRLAKFQKLPRRHCDKLDQICIEYLSIFENEYDVERLKPVFLCYLKLNIVEDVLYKIEELGRDRIQQKEALKFLLYFEDIDQLFSCALGTYRTQIALIVAGASNKDPKEYIALLNDFDKIRDERLRCYHIDMHLKRYDKALEHLTESFLEGGDEKLSEQILGLVVSHRLYKHALNLLDGAAGDVAHLKESIWKKYGDYLLEKRCYTEAGVAFSKALDCRFSYEYLQASINSYLLANDFEMALAVVSRFSSNEFTNQEPLVRIFRQLVERGRCLDACIVSQNLSDNVVSGCMEDLARRGNWFLMEFMLPKAHKKYIEQHNGKSEYVEGPISIQCNSWVKELGTAEEQFERLKHLLTSRNEQTNHSHTAEGYFASDSLSTVDGSELSSTASDFNNQRVARSGVSSIKTRNSSKNTKSQSSKNRRINLKEGSKHEDIALILELKKFMSKQKANQERAMTYSSASFNYLGYQEAVDLSGQLRDILSRSFKFSKEVSELLWPVNQHVEQKYSLYRRFSNVLSPGNESFENVDFEILMRPELSDEPTLFELSRSNKTT